MIDPVTLLQDLIRCASVTPLDEGAQDVLINALKPLGFTAHDVTRNNIRNTFLVYGDTQGSNAPHFCFAGHTDVVPAGEESKWKHPPFSAVIEDGKMYGRGTSDMKGNIACFVAAVAKYLENHKPDGCISLLITGDEEAEAVDGTVKVLEWMRTQNLLPHFTLVGEPSNPNTLGEEIKIGRRGSLTGHMTVKGTQGHVAYPHLADNPMPHMVKLLDALISYEFDQGNAHFPATNLEISTIDTGNKADNVIPAQAEAHFNIRFNDNWTATTLETRVREILDNVSKQYELTCISNAEAFITQPGVTTDMVVDAIKEITGNTPEQTTHGGTSDARFIAKYGNVVEFGLVNKTIHQTDEHIEIADLHTLTDIYALILKRYFA